jgi:hypothetical protein
MKRWSADMSEKKQKEKRKTATNILLTGDTYEQETDLKWANYLNRIYIDSILSKAFHGELGIIPE